MSNLQSLIEKNEKMNHRSMKDPITGVVTLQEESAKEKNGTATARCLDQRFGHRPLALRFERSASGLARPSSSITNFDGRSRARARLTVEREGSRHALLTR